MKLRIVRADPTGNTTILALTPVRAEQRSAAARALMRAFGGWAEQVGFLSKLPDGSPRLDMMGGEFCGNASLSSAAYLAQQAGRTEAGITLSVSGAEGPVFCRVRQLASGLWAGTVGMPLPLSVKAEPYSLAGRILSLDTVRLPGITHLVVPAGSLSRGEAEAAVPRLAAASGESALGILLFDENALRMDPLVHVSATGSSVWEHGCASGTAAVGAALAVRSGRDRRETILQPGGSIGVAAGVRNGSICALSITGQVRLLGECVQEI